MNQSFTVRCYGKVFSGRIKLTRTKTDMDFNVSKTRLCQEISLVRLQILGHISVGRRLQVIWWTLVVTRNLLRFEAVVRKSNLQGDVYLRSDKPTAVS